MGANIEEVKKLRDQTGLSITQCKNALEEAGGDVSKAIDYLKSKGASAVEKKQSRNLASGYIGVYVHNNGKVGAIVRLLCETDFVSKNEEFINLSKDIAMHITAFSPTGITKEDSESPETALFEQPFLKDDSKTIKELIENSTNKFGERIEVDSFKRIEI